MLRFQQVPFPSLVLQLLVNSFLLPNSHIPDRQITFMTNYVHFLFLATERDYRYQAQTLVCDVTNAASPLLLLDVVLLAL